MDNNGGAFCCTAYETVNDTLCTNINDGSTRPSFTIRSVEHHDPQSTPDSNPSQHVLQRRNQKLCPSSMPDSAPVIVGVSIGIPLSATLFITLTFCVVQRKQLHRERRRATKVATKNGAGRAYVVLPNQRVVPGRGVIRTSESTLEGVTNSFEIDGRELKREQWPLPPLPPLAKAQAQIARMTTTGPRKPSLVSSTMPSGPRYGRVNTV